MAKLTTKEPEVVFLLELCEDEIRHLYALFHGHVAGSAFHFGGSPLHEVYKAVKEGAEGVISLTDISMLDVVADSSTNQNVVVLNSGDLITQNEG